MTKLDRPLAKAIGAFLRASANTGFLNFAAGGGWYRTADYAFIGTLLSEGKIRLMVDDNPLFSGVGEYHTDDVLTLSANQGQAVFVQALAVHEATHAIQDKAKLKLRVLDAEVGAYIAQGTYLAKRKVLASAFGGPEKQIFVEAIQIGHRVLKGEKVGNHTSALKSAIIGHPFYATAKSTQFTGDG